MMAKIGWRAGAAMAAILISASAGAFAQDAARVTTQLREAYVNCALGAGLRVSVNDAETALAMCRSEEEALVYQLAVGRVDLPPQGAEIWARAIVSKIRLELKARVARGIEATARGR